MWIPLINGALIRHEFNDSVGAGAEGGSVCIARQRGGAETVGELGCVDDRERRSDKQTFRIVFGFFESENYHSGAHRLHRLESSKGVLSEAAGSFRSAVSPRKDDVVRRQVTAVRPL